MSENVIEDFIDVKKNEFIGCFSFDHSVHKGFHYDNIMNDNSDGAVCWNLH